MKNYNELENRKWIKVEDDIIGQKIYYLNGFRCLTNVNSNGIEIFTEKVSKFRNGSANMTQHTIQFTFDKWGESMASFVLPPKTSIHTAKKKALKMLKELIENNKADFYE